MRTPIGPRWSAGAAVMNGLAPARQCVTCRRSSCDVPFIRMWDWAMVQCSKDCGADARGIGAESGLLRPLFGVRLLIIGPAARGRAGPDYQQADPKKRAQ